MKTFILDIIPKIQRHSQKLENLTLLTNQHWVVIDEIENSKSVYIFRSNGDLLVSKNGKVNKAKWEYLGNNSLLIDIDSDSYLFKHGFFDEKVLALKLDGKEEYALLLNETAYKKELNSIERVNEFLEDNYLKQGSLPFNEEQKIGPIEREVKFYETDEGQIEVQIVRSNEGPWIGDPVWLNGNPAPDGKYYIGVFKAIIVEEAKVKKTSWI